MNETPDRNMEREGTWADPEVKNLAGLVRLGKKREALRLARRILKREHITPEAFGEALGVILEHAVRLKPWTPVVESAHERLLKRGQKAVCFWMQWFYTALDDYDAASRFIPQRFSGENVLLELAFAMETVFALNRMDLAEKLAARLPQAIALATQPEMQSQLRSYQAEYLARRGSWDKAIEILEPHEYDDLRTTNAVTRIVELRVAQALRAVRNGLQLVEKFKKDFDPELDTTLTKVKSECLDEEEKRLKRLESRLERNVPPERQKELRVDRGF